MDKARYFYAAAALLSVAAALVSCAETAKGDIKLGNDDTNDTYSIITASGIENGYIQLSQSGGSEGQTISVAAYPAPPSPWKGPGNPPAINRATDDGEPLYPWYLSTLIVTYGEKNTAVSWSKVSTNKWIFNMPAGDVTVYALFTQTPKPSNELAVLGVSRVSTLTPQLLSGRYNYKVNIPNVLAADDKPQFYIVALAEDPNAEVIITDAGNKNASGQIELIEGERDYKITVEPASGSGLEKTEYKLTVSYEPDLTLKSIELGSPSDPAWRQNLPVLDTQTVNSPYSNVTVNARPLETGISVHISNGDEPLPSGSSFVLTEVSMPVKITLSKRVTGNFDYSKIYILNLVYAPEFPHQYLASGGGISIIKEGEKYYETHLFTYKQGAEQNFSFNEGVNPADFETRILVVGGGGGGGYGGGGGGAGGFLTKNNLLLENEVYTVKIGKGGAGKGDGQNNGEDGGDSAFGIYTAYGGGGGAGYNSGNGGDGRGLTNANENNVPGSGGGGGANSGKGGNGANNGAAQGSYEGGGGGGASKPGTGAGGGAGKTSDITGSLNSYAAGGNGSAPSNGADNTGNGGGGGGTAIGANYSDGGNGGSGIVVVRFPMPE
ncbi:MAG: hypothetical protein LBC27_05180 [Spirochaetaceae bacterium]|jgi:hypothetical protein|nr:hypothetical protein [Spirochaetaceae bacterium]